MHISNPEDDHKMTELLCELQLKATELGMDDKSIDLAERFMLDSHRAGQQLAIGRSPARGRMRRTSTTAS
jgi:hypothetical protein